MRLPCLTLPKVNRTLTLRRGRRVVTTAAGAVVPRRFPGLLLSAAGPTCPAYLLSLLVQFRQDLLTFAPRILTPNGPVVHMLS